MKNVLFVTQSINGGGLETFIITKAEEYRRLGYNVHIACNSDNNSNCEFKIHNIDFTNNIYYNLINNIEIMENIIKDNNITEVHIHPFTTYYASIIACINRNIPYCLYFHGIDYKEILNIEASYNLLGRESSMFLNLIAFPFASKYIYVSNEVRSFYESKYFLNKNKGSIFLNSLNIKNIKKNKDYKRLNKFVIVSRLDNDKFISIKNSIDIFLKYRENNLNATLDIIGYGNITNKVKEYIKGKEDFINLLGYKENVMNELYNYQVIFGMGRVILEGMICKLLPILVDYDGCSDIISKDNINNFEYSNLSGRNCKLFNNDEVVSKLIQINNISNISKYNYEYVINNRDIRKNIVLLEDRDVRYNIEFAKFKIKEFLKLKHSLDYLIEENEKLNLKINNLLEEDKEKLGGVN